MTDHDQADDDLFPEEYKMGNTPEKTAVKKAKKMLMKCFPMKLTALHAGKCCDNKEN